MIPFDFEYYQPETIAEAVNLYNSLADQGKKVMYYGGGTEIISFCRLYQFYPQAVIDIKAIPELNVLEQTSGKLAIGAAVTLNKIQESNLFPLLSWCGGRVADHTIRNKITLGGNLCATIPYRETSLALLISESVLIIEGKSGQRKAPIGKVFQESLRLKEGELLVQVQIGRECCEAPFISLKKTSDGNVSYPQDKIGYPVVSAAGLKFGGKIRAAFSGLCVFPFRSAAIEDVLNREGLSRDEKLSLAVENLPAEIHDDINGSAGYREFVLKNMIAEILERLDQAR